VEAKNSKNPAPAPAQHWDKCQRTKKNQWIFRGCKIPRTSGSLILIFSKIPRTDLFFYFDVSKIWNWWFFETKLNHPTLELKSSNQSRMGIYC